jgi:hypothetical protein
MFIQITDPAHPVLLCLHGGLPEYFMTDRYPTGPESDFTVVWWEQRSAGFSYRGWRSGLASTHPASRWCAAALAICPGPGCSVR